MHPLGGLVLLAFIAVSIGSYAQRTGAQPGPERWVPIWWWALASFVVLWMQSHWVARSA
jgi:hypothetical protein